MAMAVIGPTWMVDDRVQANAFNLHTLLKCDGGLVAYVSEPTGPFIVLYSGLGDEDRKPIALMEFDEYLAERPV